MRGRAATVAIGGVVALMLVLTACGGGGGGDSSGARTGCPIDALDRADGPVTIRFWHVQARANLEELRRQVDRFHASQTRVRVRLVDQTAYPELLQKYRAGLTTGDVPDIAQFEETAVQTLLDSRSTVTMGDCVRRDRYDLADFVPRTISYYTVEGELRALPWNVSNPILLFDVSKLTAAGLDPARPPGTLDEVRSAARQIVDRGAARYGIALRVAPYFNEFFYAKAGQQYVNHDGGRSSRATKAELDNETGRSIWAWWKDMVDSGLALNTGSAVGNFDHLLAIGTGDAAMSIEASSALGTILQVLEGGQYPGVKIGAAPLPSLRARGGVPVGDGSLWITNRTSPEKQAAAWEFAKFLVAPEQQATLAVGTGHVPVRRSAAAMPIVQEFWARQPAFKVAYDQLLQPGGPAANGSVIGNYQGVRDAVINGITSMLTQDKSPADALATTQRNADRAITEYNARVTG
jgi:sn-glycerol 3-phosphate transport system substrate-binding protein